MFTRQELTLLLDCVNEYVVQWEANFEDVPPTQALKEAKALSDKLETLVMTSPQKE